MKRLASIIIVVFFVSFCTNALTPLGPLDIEIASRDHAVVGNLVVNHADLWEKVCSGGQSGWTNVTKAEREMLLNELQTSKLEVTEILKGSMTNGIYEVVADVSIMPFRSTNGVFGINFTDFRWGSPPSRNIEQPCIWFFSPDKSDTKKGTNALSISDIWDVVPLSEKEYWKTVIKDISENPLRLKKRDDKDYGDWRRAERIKEIELKSSILVKKKPAQPSSPCDSQPCGFRTHER